MKIQLHKPSDLLSLLPGSVVTKRNLYDLIQYSKVDNSQYYEGPELLIGNTPQQGINWLGTLPDCGAVIIKTRAGSYAEDGWANSERTTYHYSFKAKGEAISYTEKANASLINQPQYLYPILLFAENKESWIFEGAFSVSAIENKFVILDRRLGMASSLQPSQEERLYQEGDRAYAAHLMVERSKSVVDVLKNSAEWLCDICATNFIDRYGVDYIEAHHKIPISTYSSKHVIKPQDFALLCPNCHRAVHIYMKKEHLTYEQIRVKLGSLIIR